jgi:hypothetical protein
MKAFSFMEEENYIKQIREKADSYERTIQTIVAFDSAVRWDDLNKSYSKNTLFFQGRRLSKKLTSPNEYVSPDIVIQLSNEYGIVAEIKITGSSDQDFENANAQVKNYDRELIGWKTDSERIRLHDLSLLVNDLKRGIAKRYFVDKTFQRKFSLIACARISEANEFYKIEKYYGTFSDDRLDQKLSDPVAVPLEKVIHIISSIKFYDAEPPIEYTMNVLWMNIFNEIMEREDSGKTISVSCKDVTEIIREKYAFQQVDSRQPKIPKEVWIRKALDIFVKIKYAKKDPASNDKYLVKYTHKRKDSMLDFFSKKHFNVSNNFKKKSEKDNDQRQFEFPPNN